MGGGSKRKVKDGQEGSDIKDREKNKKKEKDKAVTGEGGRM